MIVPLKLEQTPLLEPVSHPETVLSIYSYDLTLPTTTGCNIQPVHKWHYQCLTETQLHFHAVLLLKCQYNLLSNGRLKPIWTLMVCTCFMLCFVSASVAYKGKELIGVKGITQPERGHQAGHLSCRTVLELRNYIDQGKITVLTAEVNRI